MGRGKIEIKRIENKTTRQMTFSKRRTGLIKKTRELSILSEAHIGLIIFSATGKLYEFCSEPNRMPQLIDRYLETNGLRLPDLHDDREKLYHEMEALRIETCKLELHLRPYQGHDLTSIPLHELEGLEQQLEHSVLKVRERKNELVKQQLENLRRKRRMLEEDNNNMQRLLHELRAAEFQQAGIETKQVEYQQFLEQFQYYNVDHQQQLPSSVLQLARLPSEIDPYYHLLMINQPNLQNYPTPNFS